MTLENLNVYTPLFDALKENAPVRKARKPRAKPTFSKTDAQLLYTIQVKGANSMEQLAGETGLPLEQVLASLTALTEQGYVAISEVNGRNVFQVTNVGKSLTLGEM